MPGLKASILIVEDEESVRASLAEILKVLGHRVRCAADGLAALVEIKDVYKRQLECTGNELCEVVAQLAEFKFGNDESFIDEANQRMDECAGHGVMANQAAVL